MTTTDPLTQIPLTAQVVRVVNEGTIPFLAQYDKVKYRIQPGEQMYIPYMAMVMYMGHPDAMDVPGDRNRRFRTDEFDRLCVVYGVYENADQIVDVNGNPYPDGLTRWEHDKPKLAAYTASGDRIVTVVDDREGRHITPANQTALEQGAIQQAMAAMQQQIAALQARLAVGQSDPSAMTNSQFEPPLTPEHDRTSEPLVSPTMEPLLVAPVANPLTKRTEPPEDDPQLTPGV